VKGGGDPKGMNPEREARRMKTLRNPKTHRKGKHKGDPNINGILLRSDFRRIKAIWVQKRKIDRVDVQRTKRATRRVKISNRDRFGEIL
jgi:hypothetical protein